MRPFVLACAFAAAAAGSTAQAGVGSWYRCMFGGPFVGDYCDGGIGSGCSRCCDNYSCGGWYCAYGCAGCNAGMNGGFYRCPTCLESLRDGHRGQTRCAPATCPPASACKTCAPAIPATAPPMPAPVPPTVAPAPATPTPASAAAAPTPAPAATAP